MWIRSQDKEKIVKCENVFVAYDNGVYIIKYFVEKYNYFVLGEYSTKEKALKVLDMIQEKICGMNGIFQLNGRYDNTQRKYIKQRIDEEIKEGIFLPDSHITYIPRPLFFQMPQDDEV